MIERLKGMNSRYPDSTEDYDKMFLQVLLTEVFCKTDMKHCGKKETIAHFSRPALKFVKGNYGLVCSHIVRQSL